MPIEQVLWSLDDHTPLQDSTLASEAELEDALEANIALLDPDWMVIGRQTRTPDGKYMDLFCLDHGAKRIVVELKKDRTPRDVTAQALEYAAWAEEMEAGDLSNVYAQYTAKYQQAEKELGQAFKARFGTELTEEQLEDTQAKIVIVAARMDRETERIVNYLHGYGVDINILLFKVYEYAGKRLLSRAWLREDRQAAAVSAPENKEWNEEYYVSFGEYPNGRSWEDARKFGFISGGGKEWYSRTLDMLRPGDRVWVNIPHCGYVGTGVVTGEKQPAVSAKLATGDGETAFLSLPLKGTYCHPGDDDPANAEYLVPVRWDKAVGKAEAVKELGFFGNQNTVCRPLTAKWRHTVTRLRTIWNITE